MYEVTLAPTKDTLELSRAVQTELAKVGEVLSTYTEIPIPQMHVEPAKPREGMLRYSDGVDWDPVGTGVPTFVAYTGGAWRNLQFGGSGGVTSVFGRTGDVVALQADYDSFFLTPAEGGALYEPLDATILRQADVKNSIEFDVAALQLVGDLSAPGNNQVYGTDGVGAKGWKADPSGGGLDPAAAEEITGGWLFSTIATRFSENVDIENGKVLHLEGTVAAEFADIGVVSANNSLLFSQTGLDSGGLHGAWFQMPVRIRDGRELVIYNAANNDSVTLAHNGTDLNISTVGTRHINILSLTGNFLVGGLQVNPITINITTQLEDVTNAINTEDEKVLGFMVFNSTTSKPVWALGPNANSVWVDATGATVHIPV